MSLRDRLMPQDQPAPPPPRLSYYLVRLHGDHPGPTGNAIDEEGANRVHAALLRGAPAGSQICTYINERPVTLAEVEAAVRAGATEEALALLEQLAAQRQGVAS
jgi:hypothetical protein